MDVISVFANNSHSAKERSKMFVDDVVVSMAAEIKVCCNNAAVIFTEKNTHRRSYTIEKLELRKWWSRIV